MLSKPLVSIVVPIYNGERYVKKCLENILNQSYKNIEIIVVNDGSSDNTKEIIETFPVKLISFEKNRGLSAARNAGIDAATGEFIHFMDVDDAINEDFYKELVDAIQETNADIACSGMINQKKPYYSFVYKKNSFYEDIYGKLKATYVGKWGYVWRYLFKSDFMRSQQLRFEEGRLIEDMFFSLVAVYHSKKLVVVANAIYYYNYNENSILNNKDKIHIEKRKKDWQHVADLVKEFEKKHNIKIPGFSNRSFGFFIKKNYRKLQFLVFDKRDF